MGMDRPARAEPGVEGVRVLVPGPESRANTMDLLVLLMAQHASSSRGDHHVRLSTDSTISRAVGVGGRWRESLVGRVTVPVVPQHQKEVRIVGRFWRC
jgi:hypothetical protein